MLAATGCFSIGLALKLVSNSMRNQTSDLQGAKSLAECSSHNGPHYMHFRGALKSDSPGTVNDPDTGLDFSVVCIQKKISEVNEITTVTTRGVLWNESTKREDKCIIDSGRLYCGNNIRLDSHISSREAGLLEKLGLGAMELHLDDHSVRERIPLDTLFSNFEPATTININTKKGSRLHKNERGLQALRTASNNSQLEKSETRTHLGTRKSVHGATTGTELTVIGDATVDSRGNWYLLPESRKHSIITPMTFEMYKHSKESSAELVGNLGTGLFITAAAIAASSTLSSSREQ